MPYFGNIPTCCAIGNKLELTEIDPKATRIFSRCCADEICGNTINADVNKKIFQRINLRFPLPTVAFSLLFGVLLL